MLKDDTITTISGAKVFLEQNRNEGVVCPCCDQVVKMYKRKLNSAMAIALYQIFKASKADDYDYIHVENTLNNLPNLPASIRGDFPKLRFWGLIEPLVEKREDGSNRNGMYRITMAGVNFIWGKSTTYSHVFLYNNTAQGFSNEMVTFRDCLGSKFNYDELMTGI